MILNFDNILLFYLNETFTDPITMHLLAPSASHKL